MPRWFCPFLSSLLCRAEAAAGYLVILSARVLIKEGVRLPQDAWRVVIFDDRSAVRYSESVAAHLGRSPDGEISCASLRARIRVLKALLENLPRHAVRLLRRCAVGLGKTPVLDIRARLLGNAEYVRRKCERVEGRIEYLPDKRLSRMARDPIL